jgi:site-specific recombinase XerD
MTDAPSFPALVQYFFAQHLCANKQASPKTVASYRDTFRLLLTFLQQQTGRPASALKIADVDVQAVLAFLDHLESKRHNKARSRNARLYAIRAFFRVVALKDPANIGIVDRVMAIPGKRTTKPLITYLTREEIDAILAVPDQSTWVGSRDHALFLTLYNTGARASEITQMICEQVSFGSTTFVQIHGKGRKERTVPLWPQTSRVLRQWFRKLGSKDKDLAFPALRGGALSNDGLDYALQKAVEEASEECGSLTKKRVTPHVIRHTTAMHLLQSGVDIAVIALWLGHESIETTHGYIEADLNMKERALAKLTPAKGRLSRFEPGDDLLQFLAGL